jgi:DNA-binding MarR family transcriptional regulator
MELLDSDHWSDLHALLAHFDREIMLLYAEAGIEGIRPRFVGPLLALHRFGPMTIRELADRRGVSHSAMSQTAAALRSAGLVEPAAGADKRTRRVRLTAKARAVAPFMEAEWRATEATVRGLDAELPYALSRVTADLRALVNAKPFGVRLRENLPSAATGAPQP